MENVISENELVRQKLPDGKELYQMEVGTLIVGCGAAGLKAAVSLDSFGDHDILLVSEDFSAGTSRNTGSDKQTYYKLSLAGPAEDSVRAMAEDLFSGECVDGEHALCEAALSVRSFYHLADIGVPFPENDYGESIGYRTDHDTRGRASSVGPYTSRLMTEALFREARTRGVRMQSGLQLLSILTNENGVSGALFLWIDEMKETQDEMRFLLIRCTNLILACGGPAAIFRDSVYPVSQNGASGAAFLSGICGRNLTEWQFGMASVSPRWNVSGSYMQVLPRFVSTAPDGTDVREFLMDYYEDPGLLLRHTFLKGYEWPFDAGKCAGGSSLVDLFVFEETVTKGRRVFLDFTKNPEALTIGYPEEAYAYLSQADAIEDSPVLRLKKLNAPAYMFYLTHGVDLSREMLEIRVCAQHNNGGLLVDDHWETNIPGIYAVGEMACTHGVRRPGGSALNAGQVGAYRAAEHIAFSERNGSTSADIEEVICFLSGIKLSEEDHIDELYEAARANMSAAGGMIRNEVKLESALDATEAVLCGFYSAVHAGSPDRLSRLFRLYDVLVTQKIYLSAMLNYLRYGGGSRGSALYTDPNGEKPHIGLPASYCYSPDSGRTGKVTQEIWYREGRCETLWRPVRPIPDAGLFFETEWAKFRKRRKNT